MLEKDIGKILEATLSSGSDVRLKVLSPCCSAIRCFTGY